MPDDVNQPMPGHTDRFVADLRHAFYANAFSVSGSPGEVSILLGLSNVGTTTTFSHCLVLSPQTAGRLIDALTNMLARHNAAVGAVPSEAPADDVAAGLLLKLADELGADYGLERSFRVSSAGLQTGRFLISIGIDALGRNPRETALSLCQSLSMPQEFRQAVAEHLDEANILHLGYEGGSGRCLYKLYLERGAALEREPQQGADSAGRLLHLAFKWDPQDLDARYLTRYLWHPGLSFEEIARRLAAIFQGGGGAEPRAIFAELLDLAGRRVEAGDLFYLEAAEPGNPRRSFDLSLYPTGLEIGEVRPLLMRMARYFSLPGDEVARLCDSIADQPLGHVSGGIHRRGEPFFNVYYGVRGRRGKTAH